MRSGLSGFRIFSPVWCWAWRRSRAWVRCRQAFLTGLAEQGRTLLGGDVVGAVWCIARRDAGRARISSRATAACRKPCRCARMAYALKSGNEGERQLVELKAVDGAYPLYGAVGAVARTQRLPMRSRASNNICGAVAEQTLARPLASGARRHAAHRRAEFPRERAC